MKYEFEIPDEYELHVMYFPHASRRTPYRNNQQFIAQVVTKPPAPYWGSHGNNAVGPTPQAAIDAAVAAHKAYLERFPETTEEVTLDLDFLSTI